MDDKKNRITLTITAHYVKLFYNLIHKQFGNGDHTDTCVLCCVGYKIICCLLNDNCIKLAATHAHITYTNIYT